MKSYHFHFLSLFLMLSSCATFNQNTSSNFEEIVLPVAIQPLFSACTPTDGTAQFSANLDGSFINGLDLVWNIPSDNNWDIQLNTPAGDSQLEISKKSDSFSVSGDIKPDLKLDSQNRLYINGYMTPFFASEFPCLLAGNWPVKWLRFLRSTTGHSKSLKLNFTGQDDGRDFAVSTESISQQRIQSCATIAWGGFLGFFKKSVKTCIVLTTGSYSVEIGGIKNYSIKWWTNHESN